MEKINVAELLKDCPKGLELDCTMYENVYFGGLSEDKSDEYPITVNIIDDKDNEHNMYLTKEGCWSPHLHAKCVIFPKGKTTWEGFHRPFNVGDIVFTTLGNIAIIRKPIGGELFYVYGIMVGNGFYKDETAKVVVERPASEEEKAKLFQVIKDKGYKWNPETKTLEKLVEPNFKVGDKITDKNKFIYRITAITDKGYKLHDLKTTFITFEAADSHFVKVVDIFDINTLVPFESRVLVRAESGNLWKPAIFGCCVEDKYAPYYVLGGTCWSQCIPYEGNEHLRGKTDDCDEFFKTWK